MAALSEGLWVGQFCFERSVSMVDNTLDMIKHNFSIMGCLGFHLKFFCV